MEYIKTPQQLAAYLLLPSSRLRWEKYARIVSWGHTYFSDEVIDHAINDLMEEFIHLTTTYHLHPRETIYRNKRKLRWTKLQIRKSMLERIKKAVAYHRKTTLDNHGSRRKLQLTKYISDSKDLGTTDRIDNRLSLGVILKDFSEKEQIILYLRLGKNETFTNIHKDYPEFGSVSNLKKLWYNNIYPKIIYLRSTLDKSEKV